MTYLYLYILILLVFFYVVVVFMHCFIYIPKSKYIYRNPNISFPFLPFASLHPCILVCLYASIFPPSSS
ncbi:hypothetical protein BZA77DRAFT_309805 [Pyronema omphalodes]|nr:hypothetical protein BZA77DRAFT_309805 [Pyronema omphalodes]